jgi:hypothetical protein
MCIFVVLCVDETLFYMCEYSDAIKLPNVRGNLKNVTIDLAIHSHFAPIFRLRCISIAREKYYIYVKNLNT